MANPFVALNQLATALATATGVPVYCDGEGLARKAEASRIILLPKAIDFPPGGSTSRIPKVLTAAKLTFSCVLMAPTRDYAALWVLLEHFYATVRKELNGQNFTISQGEFDPESLEKSDRSVKLELFLTLDLALMDPTPIPGVVVTSVNSSIVPY